MTKKKFNPSAALGYKRIKPLYDKAVSDLVIETARADDNYERICELSVELDSTKAKVDRQKDKLQRAGDRVGSLIRLNRALAERNHTLVTENIKVNSKLLGVAAQLRQAGKWDVAARNQFLAAKNLELAKKADGYRGELERIRLRGAYFIIAVGVVALGYALGVVA